MHLRKCLLSSYKGRIKIIIIIIIRSKTSCDVNFEFKIYIEINSKFLCCKDKS